MNTICVTYTGPGPVTFPPCNPQQSTLATVCTQIGCPSPADAQTVGGTYATVCTQIGCPTPAGAQTVTLPPSLICPTGVTEGCIPTTPKMGCSTAQGGSGSAGAQTIGFTAWQGCSTQPTQLIGCTGYLGCEPTQQTSGAQAQGALPPSIVCPTTPTGGCIPTIPPIGCGEDKGGAHAQTIGVTGWQGCGQASHIIGCTGYVGCEPTQQTSGAQAQGALPPSIVCPTTPTGGCIPTIPPIGCGEDKGGANAQTIGVTGWQGCGQASHIIGCTGYLGCEPTQQTSGAHAQTIVPTVMVETCPTYVACNKSGGDNSGAQAQTIGVTGWQGCGQASHIIGCTGYIGCEPTQQTSGAQAQTIVPTVMVETCPTYVACDKGGDNSGAQAQTTGVTGWQGCGQASHIIGCTGYLGCEPTQQTSGAQAQTIFLTQVCSQDSSASAQTIGVTGWQGCPTSLIGCTGYIGCHDGTSGAQAQTIFPTVVCPTLPQSCLPTIANCDKGNSAQAQTIGVTAWEACPTSLIGCTAYLNCKSGS